MTKIKSLFVRAIKDQSAQVLPWSVFMMILFLGMTGLVVDVGHAMFCQRELQAATDAAALAGARYLYTSNPATFSTSAAATTALQYSAVTGNLNAKPNLWAVTINTTGSCLSTLVSLGLPCTTGTTDNAIRVVETATVPTYFIRALKMIPGLNPSATLTVQATATASALGTYSTPYNVVILVDTTASMNTTDGNCGGKTRIECALGGVSTLLTGLSPCPPTTSGTCAIGSAQDRVALMTFPAIYQEVQTTSKGKTTTTNVQSLDSTCGGTLNSPTQSPAMVAPYPTPAIPGTATTTSLSTGYDPTGVNTATYLLTSSTDGTTGFVNDYRASDSTTTLNSSSNLASATGAVSGCNGLQSPGGESTYYAGALYAAQTALLNAQYQYPSTSPVPTAQNIIILISDGAATAGSSNISGGPTTRWASGSGGATSTYTNYPSSVDECQQAVAAANWAKQQGTIIYSIAYGAETTGCTTDSSGPQANIAPCLTMSEIATDADHFYSDFNQTGTGIDASCTSIHPATAVNEIFSSILENLVPVRLIPDGTT